MSTPAICVLLVEDDAVDRMACRRALAQAGEGEFSVIEAESGRAGIALARSQQPDCVLLDYRLPDLNGLEFLRTLNDAHGEPPPPVVILTGAGDLTVAVEAMRNGARDYLLKDGAGAHLALLPAVVRRVVREQRLRAEQQQTVALLHLVTDAAPGLVGYVGRDERYQFANARYRDWFGLDRRALVGKSMRELWGETAYGQMRAHIEQALAGVPQRFEMSVGGDAEAAREIEVRYLPQRDAEGKVLGLCTLKLDVTERKRAERELRERREQLAHLLRLHTAGELAAALTHELAQPLSSIGAYSEAALRLLRAGRPAPEKLMHSLEQTITQVQRAGAVLRQLRGFLRKDAIERAEEGLDLNAVIRGVDLLLASECNGGYELCIELGERPLPVRANRIAIEQILMNLTRNSIEAMRAAGMAQGRIRITAARSGQGQAQVTVADTGPGLDPGTHAQLFKPFYTTKREGLGMGLAISRSLAEAQDGRLWPEDHAGPGAVFHFTLPLGE